jgi:hypothetical protein
MGFTAKLFVAEATHRKGLERLLRRVPALYLPANSSNGRRRGSVWCTQVTARVGLSLTREGLRPRSPLGHRNARGDRRQAPSHASYLWAMSLTRIYEVFLHLRPHCAEPMRISPG